MTFYKNTKFYGFYIASGVLILVFLVFLIISKNRPIVADDVEALYFSKESGFYDDEFDLAMYAPSGEIYYTLDGSDPTKDSIKYEGPIHLKDATSNENVYCLRDDVSAAFRTDLMEKYDLFEHFDPMYKIPDYPVDKCNVVRAVVYYGDDKYSEIKTATYYVGFDDKPGYDGVNVLSITTDPDNLFAYEDGIYVLGQKFDEYEQYIGPEDVNWWHWQANFTRIIAEEKPASVQFFKNGKLVLSQNCGIKPHGGGSRGLYPKSLNLNVRDEYSTYDHFMYNIFENDRYPVGVTVTPGGNDNYTKLKDYLINELCSGLECSTMDFEPYVMFLDGEYWGFYWITEKYDKDYLRYHYNVLPDNLIMVKNNEIDEGDWTELQLWEDLNEFILNNDMCDPANYDRVCDMIDIDSFIDYFAVMIYISRNDDWPHNNLAAWRTRKTGTGKYNDGKWRWLVFDLNSAEFDDSMIEFDSFESTMKYPFFRDLMRNDSLRNRLLDRILELNETNFSSERVEEVLSEYHRITDEPLKADRKRFYTDDVYERCDKETKEIESFIRNRREYIPEMVEKYRNSPYG
ncbi:MAG: CotH kinase family protein [Lachnospiraceae bacterium]|nr:CotH kinase family protein [Lachnospiraceae bacterium]